VGTIATRVSSMCVISRCCVLFIGSFPRDCKLMVFFTQVYTQGVFAGVVYTGEQLIAGAIDTGDKN